MTPKNEQRQIGTTLQKQGVPSAVENTGTDNAKTALQELNQRLIDTLESVSDGFVSFDRAWRYTYVNRAASRMLQRDPTDLLGKNLWEQWPTLQRLRYREAFHACLQKQQPVHVEEFYPEPLNRWFDCRCFPTPEGVAVFFNDVTERKSNEQQLRDLAATLEKRVAERTATLELLRDIAAAANQTHDVAEVIQHCLRRVAEHHGWRCGHALWPPNDHADALTPSCHWCLQDTSECERCRQLIFNARLGEGKSLLDRVFASGEPEWTNVAAWESAAREPESGHHLAVKSAAAFPVVLGERVVAVLEFFSDDPIEPNEELLDLMRAVGMQLGQMIERTALQNHLLTVAEEEQQRIAADLHDDAAQELTGLALKAETLAEILAEQDRAEWGLAQQIVAALDDVRKRIRLLCHGLLPADVINRGIAAALEALADRMTETSDVVCTLECRDNGPVFDRGTAMQLYRIAQEAVTNAIKHGRADNVRMILDNDGHTVVLKIQDDGFGIPQVHERGGGIGLRIMLYRAGLIGGRLQIGAAPGGGALIVCRLPRWSGQDLEQVEGESG